MNGKKTRIVVAEDHNYLRTAISGLLEDTEDFEVVGEAKDGGQALRLVQELEPDVLLMDYEMPVLNGIEVMQELNEAHTGVRILILSAYTDYDFIHMVIERGADGYLIKDEVPEDLVSAIRCITGGKNRWVSRSVSKTMVAVGD